MGTGKYFFILIAMLVAFISLLDLVFGLTSSKFQLAVTIILMLIALIVAVGYYFESQTAYWLGAILFGLMLIDMIYLYYKISSYSLVWLAISAALGFIVSVSSIRKGEKEEFRGLEEKRYEIEKQLGELEKETPKVEIIREEKKPARRTKKGAKKNGSRKR